MDTQLGRTFDGGVEPSAGQWQKLALGRAMMPEEPLLLVLDEPTPTEAEADFGQRRDLLRLIVERVRVLPGRRGAGSTRLA